MRETKKNEIVISELNLHITLSASLLNSIFWCPFFLNISHDHLLDNLRDSTMHDFSITHNKPLLFLFLLQQTRQSIFDHEPFNLQTI